MFKIVGIKILSDDITWDLEYLLSTSYVKLAASIKISSKVSWDMSGQSDTLMLSVSG